VPRFLVLVSTIIYIVTSIGVPLVGDILIYTSRNGLYKSIIRTRTSRRILSVEVVIRPSNPPTLAYSGVVYLIRRSSERRYRSTIRKLKKYKRL
jgi:hypothetical protein